MLIKRPAKPGILFIDDEKDIRYIFEQIFCDDYHIHLADSTDKAYEMMLENKYQIVISDQRMPEESGVAFFAKIRTEFPDTFRMIITGHNDIEDVIDAINKGHVYYFFRKPWDEQEVRLVINNALKMSELDQKQKEMKKKLMKSEERFRDIAYSMADLIWETDDKGTYTYAGIKALDVTGYDSHELIGKTRFDLLAPKEAERLKPVFKDIIKNKKKIKDLESWYLTKSGKKICLVTNAIPKLDKKGYLTGYRGVDKDITKRKQAETSLLNTNRALRAISSCSKALVSTSNEQVLLQQVCEAIVKETGYSLVWAGYVQYDEKKTIQPVAHAGFNQGYIESIDFTWKDIEKGRGPSGTAIRTGRPDIIHNVKKDQRFRLWRSKARERGYRSVLGLPLKIRDLVFGVITIYASKTYAFEIEEVTLLEELANNLSVGINGLRVQKQKEKAEKELHLLNLELENRVEQRTNQLNKVNKHLDQLFNLTAEGLLYIGLDFKIHDANKTFLNQWGVKKNNIIGAKCYDIFGSTICSKESGNARGLKCCIQALKRGETLQENEFSHINAQGIKKTYIESCMAQQDENGNIAGLLKSIRDITDRKNYEEKIKILSRATQESPASVVITDKKGSIEYVNPKFTQLTGYTMEEILGRNPNLLKTNIQPLKMYQDLWEKILSGREWQGEFCNKKKNGEIFWESASISPIMDSSREITHFVAVKEDITKRKEMETQLRMSKEKAEAATRTKSDFLANMSHEIRTPMNAIIGLTHLVQQTNLSMKQRDYMDKIHYSSKNLLMIINDILDFSKIEAGHLKMESIDFQLKEIFFHIENLLKTNTKDKNINLLFTMDPEIPRFLKGDPLRLEQILVNLTGNAAKFTEQGQIMVSAKVLEINKSGITIEFSVKDSGIGMTLKESSKLFKPFTQADTSISRKYGGTGLGLSISKHIVKIMKGNIWFESIPDKGSTFFFTILFDIPPALDKKSFKKEDGRVPEQFQRLRGAKVLLVEDNEINQQVALELLKSRGLMVKIAANGPIAVENLETENFDAVMMDIQMPGMDGFETSRIIRNFEKKFQKTRVPIIAMTAHAMPGHRKESLLSGMDDHITKPIVPDELFKALLKYIKPGKKSPDTIKALQIIKKIKSLLSKSDTKAIKVVQDLRKSQNNGIYADKINELETALNRYDFTQGLKILKNIRDLIEGI